MCVASHFYDILYGKKNYGLWGSKNLRLIKLCLRRENSKKKRRDRELETLEALVGFAVYCSFGYFQNKNLSLSLDRNRQRHYGRAKLHPPSGLFVKLECTAKIFGGCGGEGAILRSQLTEHVKP